ncbi:MULTISPECIES: hypothetical protein [unclassified Facklamia]|uniref:hypothetical protein n=1 Tax=Aerococcaceae TaxID=186827 RepID=UPI0013B769B9|nr:MULTISPECIES: hypothetical protein [unclassified Facklamia]NEW63990.1 hypothetical protein [Facklamia sp. 252]NEW67461.1 hypothetical protein [Facklamia sp. 253]QQD65335.1 hypothetical protein JDW14_08565 [Aerococcaceae bacterium zg-252]
MKKVIKFLIVIVLSLILVGLLKIYSQRSAVKEPMSLENNQVQMIEQLLDKVEAFYANPQEKTFLRAEEIQAEELEIIKTEVAKLNTSTAEKNKVLSELMIVEWKREAQNALNAIYIGANSNEPVIKGETVQEERQLVDSLTSEQLQQLEQQFINKVPQRVSENNDDEMKQDAFIDLIREMLEKAKEQVEAYDKAVSLLEDVQKIAIEDGQIGNIAKKMREFEAAQKNVTDKGMVPKVKVQVERYLGKFLASFTEIAQEIPGYYDIAKVAVEPSVFLTELLNKNQAAFIQTTEAEFETVIEYVEVETVRETAPIITESVEPPVSSESAADTNTGVDENPIENNEETQE